MGRHLAKPTTCRRCSQDHTDITAAPEANQATTAAELMKAHLVSGEEAIMQAVLDRPEIVEAQLNSG